MKEELYFSEEHIMLRDMVRDFARNEVKPLAQELDEKGKFPHESIKKMSELGLMGIPQRLPFPLLFLRLLMKAGLKRETV